tara:strand:+ start:281 stop:568 length:288 start_codon:yes stop_codon:yes gene_type:complete
MSGKIQAVCLLTKGGKTTLLHAGSHPECVAAMREAGEKFNSIAEGFAQVIDRDGRHDQDDGSSADYQRRLAASKGAAKSPVSTKKAAKKKAASNS